MVDHREVALIYRGALARRVSAIEAVAKHFGISWSAAAKRVERARRAGFLNPTVQGRKQA